MFKRLKNNKKIILLLVFLLVSAIAFARAGGAGRSGGGGSSFSSRSYGSSSSGSSGDFFLLISFIFHILAIRWYDPLPVKITKLIIIIVIFYYIFRFYKDITGVKSIQKNRYKMNIGNKLTEKNKINGENKFKERNPEFSKEKFIEKVNKAFIEIQNAWASKNMSKVRRYVSDSVYQRFNVQFQMMNILDQTDSINNLNIVSTVIDKYEKDGNYDIIHVAIMADISDSSKSKKYPQLNESARERFVEFWSFIRHKGNDNYDMYSDNKCPNCGSPFDYDMGEVSKCQNCGVITNKGDYDWVLAEITQMTDYYEELEIQSDKKLKNKLTNIYERHNDFSIQNIEDKVSNGYLQIMKATAMKKPEGMRRFVSDDLYQKLKNYDEEFIFSRMYLNYVKVIDYYQEQNKDILAVRIKSSFKRVSIKNNKLKELDSFMKSKVEVILLERSCIASNNGDLFSHTCPSCGGPLEDTLDIRCPYCSSVLTSSDHDWLIQDILRPYEFAEEYKKRNNKISHPFEKNNFSINEIILNNMLILMYADKEIHRKEIEFAKESAKKLGFKENLVLELAELAKQNRLSLKFPKKDSEKTKLLNYMNKAVDADGKITKEEINLLKEMENALNI
jgi:rubrerythrin